MNQWWTHKTLKKINANAPAKTLHFISSPRSMCHTIKPGPRRKMLSITIKFISTPQLFCFEDCVLKQHSWDMFTSKVSNSQYFRRWTRLYPPWLFWVLVNYYYVYLFFLISKHWYIKMLGTHFELLLCTLINAKISRENALFGDSSTFNNLLHFY